MNRKLNTLILIFCTISLSSFSLTAQVIPDTGTTVQEPEEGTKAELLHKKLEILLSGFEYFPTREDLDKVAPPKFVASYLMKTADDIARRPSLRVRAIDALGFYKMDHVALFLKAKIEIKSTVKDRIERRTQKRMRAHAITSFAKAFGREGLNYLKKLAESEDLNIKLSAIYGIGKHGGKPGLEILKVLRPKEKNQSALGAYRKFLGN